MAIIKIQLLFGDVLVDINIEHVLLKMQKLSEHFYIQFGSKVS